MTAARRIPAAGGIDPGTMLLEIHPDYEDKVRPAFEREFEEMADRVTVVVTADLPSGAAARLTLGTASPQLADLADDSEAGQ